MRVEIYGTCTKCENEVLIPEAEVPQNIKEQIPFMHRKGLIVVPLIVAVLIIIGLIGNAF